MNLSARKPRAAESAMGRRRFLLTGATSALGCSLAQWACTAAPRTGKAKAVILIFNCGAPSHLDLWDMKPAAPDNVRGPFQPIDTNVPGIRISELMPRLASHAHRLAIVRTVHHRHTQHNSGMHWSIVGRPYRIDSTLINPGSSDFPSFGTLVGWLAQQEGYNQAVPPYVITPSPHCDSKVYLTPGQFGGLLGRRYDPFVLNADPNDANFKLANLELSDELTADRAFARRDLLGTLGSDSQAPGFEAYRELEAMRERALRVITSGEVRRAFDLSKEPPRVRDKYGRHSWGQSHLLARRLIEAGTRFVTTVNGPSITWDTHTDNTGRLKNRLVPPMERAYAALLDDLADRGLLDSTLVVWMGDFGRTPLINKEGGRDHWPQCYSVVLAGGGIRGGHYVGESDRIGAFPSLRPVTPADVHATVFRALGYDGDAITYTSPEGRPMPLCEGTPIHEVLS